MMVDVAVKVTALLGAGWILSSLLRGRAASIRHAIWVGALAATLMLPALAGLAPRIELALLPAAAAPGDANPIFVAGGSDDLERIARDLGGTSQDSHGAAVLPSAFPADAGARFSPSLTQAAVILWAAVALGLLLRTAIAHARARRMLRACSPSTARVARALRSVAAELDIPVPPLAIAPAGTMPAVVGVLRPSVMLPADAIDWSPERLRLVLLHECAHISRRDGLLQVITSLATAAYWWHPLTWLAAKQTVRERELACDDLVLAKGTPGATYARHLIDIARSLEPSRQHALAALAMARTSELEGRLIALLENRPRQTRASRALAVVLVAAGLAVAGLAPLTLVARGRQAMATASGVRLAEAAPAVTTSPSPVVPANAAADRQPAQAPAAQAAPVSPATAENARQADAGSALAAALTRALDDEDRDIRLLALTALTRDQSADTVPMLVRAVKDADHDMRAFALLQLIRLERDEARQLLPQALDDPSDDVRAIAVLGLRRLDHPDRRALALEAATDTSEDVRTVAALTLAGLEGADIDAALLKLTEDVSSDVRRAAFIALARRTGGAEASFDYDDGVPEGIAEGIAQGIAQGVASGVVTGLGSGIAGGIAGGIGRGITRDR